ncbi:hypothetical protein PilKf_02556 [Pillotina sp. SPG140]|jgi:hypothetical protein
MNMRKIIGGIVVIIGCASCTMIQSMITVLDSFQVKNSTGAPIKAVYISSQGGSETELLKGVSIPDGAVVSLSIDDTFDREAWYTLRFVDTRDIEYTTNDQRMRGNVIVEVTARYLEATVRSDQDSQLPVQPQTPQVTITTAPQTPQTPTEPAQTPTQPVQVPTQPVQTPAQPAQTPTQPIQTPTQPSQTPAQPVQTPTQPIQTPAQPAQTPTQPSQTPAQPSQTPTQPAQVPTQPVQTPVQPAQAPTQPAQTPAQPVQTPQITATATPQTPAQTPETLKPLYKDKFYLKNATDSTIRELFFSPATDDEWGEEVLKGKILNPGATAELYVRELLSDVSRYSFILYGDDDSVYIVDEADIGASASIEISNEYKADY